LIVVGLSFGVDVLGALSEKLKSQNTDTTNLFKNFSELFERYKKNEKMNEKEVISNFLTYLISFSATNFLMIRVLLELKTSIQKGTSIKDSTGGEMMPGSTSGATPSSGFGIGGFIDTGGSAGQTNSRQENEKEEEQYSLPQPQQRSIRTKETNRTANTRLTDNKICGMCDSKIAINAKFCSKCGRRQ
jgi:ribosomal protein L40E